MPKLDCARGQRRRHVEATSGCWKGFNVRQVPWLRLLRCHADGKRKDTGQTRDRHGTDMGRYGTDTGQTRRQQRCEKEGCLKQSSRPGTIGIMLWLSGSRIRWPRPRCQRGVPNVTRDAADRRTSRKVKLHEESVESLKCSSQRVVDLAGDNALSSVGDEVMGRNSA